MEVGCGTGHYIQFFSNIGLKPIGIDLSLPMLRVAKKKLGGNSTLCQGKAEELPFKTKSLDVVSLITTLEFLEDPQKAIWEAVRVSKDKILLGVLNKYSITTLGRRIIGIFRPSIYRKAKFYSIWQLKKQLNLVSTGANIKWGSTLIIPLNLQKWLGGIEKILSFKKNPFGAFLIVRILIR